MKLRPALFLLVILFPRAQAQVPENVVTEGIPPIPPALAASVAPYLRFHSASFLGWRPPRREMLVLSRLNDTAQLYLIKSPGEPPTQLTSLSEPVREGAFAPRTGDVIVYSQDAGGGERYQLYRFDPDTGISTLLTDGQSRNTSARWSRSGKLLAYTSTRRNGKDADIYLIDPREPGSGRLLLKVSGGGWGIEDWSADDTNLLISEYVSANEGALYLADVKSGALEPLTPKAPVRAAYRHAHFSTDGGSIFLTSDWDSEFLQLYRLDLASKKMTPLTPPRPWDVIVFQASPDGGAIALVTNEDGASVLRLLDLRTGQEHTVPIPRGVIREIEWRDDSRELAFSLSSPGSPSTVWTLDVRSGALQRWTGGESDQTTSGRFVEPELVKITSFDGLTFSAWLYQPDPKRFPGPRPVIIDIHGGPEGQSRPEYLGREAYFPLELGIALLAPNVRGSEGNGKTFLTLDNGLKREDSVRDIGALLEWIKANQRLDASRVAVMGHSYGGYMVLAAMGRYSRSLRAGVCVVGISNFLTFLENTQPYRRDLRRVEYGDERDDKMRVFLRRISPLTQAQEIRQPLLVVHGQNDPRVPGTEARQLVEAVRGHGGTAWYLLAKDEGHVFRKRPNADYQFLATVLFFKEFLLKDQPENTTPPAAHPSPD